jgi:hypothetical protein
VTHANSTLAELLADPRYSMPVAAHRNARLFEIHAAPRDQSCIQSAPQSILLSRRKSGLGDRLAGLTGIPHLSGLLQSQTEKTHDQTLLWSPSEKGMLAIQYLPITGRFAIDLKVEGAGIVAIDAEFYHPAKGLSSLRLIDGLLTRTPRHFFAQWQTNEGEELRGIRLSPLAPSQGDARILSSTLCKISQ